MSATNPSPPGSSYTAVAESIPAARELPRLDGRAWVGLAATAALLAVGWWGTFAEMWLRWFPAWPKTGYALGQRLTEGDSYYTHGPMVPLASLFIAFLIYKRVGAPAQRSRGARWAGAAALAGSVLLHLASVYARVTFVSGFALVGVLLGLLLVWGGWPLLRAYWLPVAFLVFMVPLPMDWIAKLNFQLKFLAGNAAKELTIRVFRVPVVMAGSYVYLAPAADGSPKVLIVENVCSGLRSLISLICFASLFALICRARGAWRLVMLAMAAPVAIACNIVRITTLNLVAHYVSVEVAGPESWVHNFSGLAVFALALAMLFGLERLILWLGGLLKRDWADQRLLGFLDHMPPAASAPATVRPMVLGSLALAGGLSLWWSAQPPQVFMNTVARAAVPAALTLDGKAYGSQDVELDRLTLTILETNDYIYRRFSRGRATPVDLLIVFSANNRKGTHPPEVCLEGAEQQVVAKALLKVPLPRLGEVTARELIVQKGRQRTYFLYVYKCGDSYTPDFLTQQARIVWNGLTSRNSSGALIRFSAPVEGEGLDEARALVLASAEALMPAIDEKLP